MSNTTNLDLERPDKGDTDWHTSLNSNMAKLDTGYGNNVATVADLPQMYIETGTFNYTTGDVITLPVEVDAINEYSVKITPTTGTGTDVGFIYVTKTTSNFTVHCTGNNTTDTFDAIIYYIGDIASYGGSIYRRWYVSPDAAITDHGDTTDTGSLAWVLNEIGATAATVELPGNKAYVISTTLVVAANVHLIFQKEAVLTDDGSNADLTINGTVDAGLYQIFNWGNGTGDLTFGEGMAKEYYPQWAGAPVNGSGNDLPATQQIADSMTSGTLRFTGGDWTFTTMAQYATANAWPTANENGQLIIANPISIKGDGRDHSIITSTLDDTYYGMIVVNGVNGVTIEDIALVGTGTAYSSNYGGGIRVLLSSRVTVKNCHFEDIRGNAVNFVGNPGLAAGDTDVDYYCTYGIVDGNTFRNVDGDGVYHIFSKYSIVVNNYFYNVGYTDAIIFEGSDHATCSNNIIINPQFRGILVNTGSSYSAVTANTIHIENELDGGAGIYLASVRNCVISGNTIDYLAGLTTPYSAIVTIPGLFDWTDAYNIISNNNIARAGYSTDITAIHIQTDYNLVKGNMISGSTYGISVDDADYNVISGNHLMCEGQDIRLAGIDGRPNPTYTYVVGNHIETSVYDVGTFSQWRYNFPDTKELTTGTPQLLEYDKWITSFTMDSSGGAITGYLKDGSYIGQTITIVMTNATTSSTISIDHHQTHAGAAEVATFDAVDETGVFMWTGTEYVTIFATCTFL